MNARAAGNKKKGEKREEKRIGRRTERTGGTPVRSTWLIHERKRKKREREKGEEKLVKSATSDLNPNSNVGLVFTTVIDRLLFLFFF